MHSSRNPGRVVGWRKRPEANVEPRSEAGIERGAEPGGTELVGAETIPVAIGAVAAVASPAPRDTATIEPREGPVRHLALALLVVLMLGCQVQESAPPALDIDQVRADLEVVAGARVFFGHQSVGRDLLAGIGALSTEAGVPLPIFDAAAGGTQGATGLFHANVGRNGAPDSKLIDFVAAASDAAQRFDLALLKFCYVDLGDESKEKSPSSLFERYETTMTSLQAQNPDLRLLHATMPLMSDPPGWKTTVKRWLGRPVWRDAAHARRGEYNERLRAKYGDAQTFDIARLESTDWDGSGSAFSIGGRVVETMVPEHTTDGGHLNEASNRLIAAAFLRSLAVALTRPDG
jgi:hypothetical protein